MTKTAEPQIAQCDRDAAAELYLAEQGTPLSPHDRRIVAEFRAGELDDWDSVQAFARHRLAAITAWNTGLAAGGEGAGDAVVRFTVDVKADGSTSLHTKAFDGAVEPFLVVDHAIAAMLAERKDMRGCPVHADVPPSDACPFCGDPFPYPDRNFSGKAWTTCRNRNCGANAPEEMWNQRAALSTLADRDATKQPNIAEMARFIIARVDELDWSGGFEDFQRDWHGHVDPPLCRLRLALEGEPISPSPENGPDRDAIRGEAIEEAAKVADADAAKAPDADAQHQGSVAASYNSAWKSAAQRIAAAIRALPPKLGAA